MKRVVFLLVLAVVLGLMFGYQSFKGCWNKNEFGDAVGKILPEMTKTNQNDIQARVVEKAKEFEIHLVPTDVKVTYEATEDKKFTERFVGKLADFDNYRAQIKVNAPVRVWGFTVQDDPIVKWQITTERAVYKANAEIEKAIKDVDNAVQPTSPRPAPASPRTQQPAPPLSRQGIENKLNPQRPDLDKELKQ